MNDPQTLSKIIEYTILFSSLIISAICHELGHGYTAYLLGDSTAKDAGRLTFNPLKHIDVFGTIIFPIVLAMIGFIPLIMFKPVPINPANFKNPEKDSIKVALAGPGTNFLLIIIMIIILQFFNLFPAIQHTIFILFFKRIFAQYFILINLILMIFNLMPIPPLDGSWVLRGFLPAKGKFYFQKFYTYFIIIFLILVITGKFHYVFGPILNFFWKITVFLIEM